MIIGFNVVLCNAFENYEKCGSAMVQRIAGNLKATKTCKDYYADEDYTAYKTSIRHDEKSHSCACKIEDTLAQASYLSKCYWLGGSCCKHDDKIYYYEVYGRRYFDDGSGMNVPVPDHIIILLKILKYTVLSRNKKTIVFCLTKNKKSNSFYEKHGGTLIMQSKVKFNETMNVYGFDLI